ncbi:MAG: ATP-dependent DNA ligase [Candidatus Bathyarchaeota archaeon]|nr:ATP-dependent DNA ligase [Candidatus Bathyarchaeota archaeon]MDH5732205.1 ATP-dependent DNA ligase [Candidatus Bathyarchaeota archaeon]
MPTEFRTLAELCEKLEGTSKRLLMRDLVADFLKKVQADEVEPATSMILGRAFPKWDQRTLEVSWATLRGVIKRLANVDWKEFREAFSHTGDVGAATKIILEKGGKIRKQVTLFEKALTILEVRRRLAVIAETTGSGSRERKERLLETLLGVATSLEAKYLVKILIGEMRTGFFEGMMELAVSEAFQIPLDVVQRASMLAGDVSEVAAIAKVQGKEGVLSIRFQLFRPIRPMMAQMAADVDEALRGHGGESAFEDKLDGARIQIHKSGDKVKVYSRRLTDVTESLPEVVQLVRDQIGAREAILEGEVIAVGKDGSPMLFQHLMRRFRRVHNIEEMTKQIPIQLYLFDLLYLDEASLITDPYVERRRKLKAISGDISLTKQVITNDRAEAERFLREAMSRGHEGLMAKKLDSRYTPGVRGKRWFKIKRTLEPLDLVVVAAEWGYGRRHGWLSDYYLAARDSESGELLMVGKTFKGLTDTEIIGMTKRLKESAVKEEHGRVVVVPKIVVEVAYNEIQKSPKYKCGMALRFARITRIRDDKSPAEADTIQKVKEIYEQQFEKKARYP